MMEIGERIKGDHLLHYGEIVDFAFSLFSFLPRIIIVLGALEIQE